MANFHKSTKNTIPFNQICYVKTPSETNAIIHLRNGQELLLTGEEKTAFLADYEEWLEKNST